MMIWILLILLLFEFFWALTFSKGDYINPTVIFSFVFLIATIDLSMMESFWAVNLNEMTVVIICVGVFAFNFIYFFLEMFIGKKCRRKSIISREIIKVDRVFCNFLLGVYTVTIILAFYYVIGVARRYGGTGSIGQLLGFYNGLLKGATTDDVSYPFYIQILTDICGLGSYVWGYIIVNNYVVTRRIEKKYLMFIFLGLIICLESGSRGDAISILFCIMCMAIMILRKSAHAKKITKKFYMTGFVAVIMLVGTFQFFGTAMGRDSNIFTPFEYFSIYLGAPILNLNTMVLRYGGYNTEFFNYTFSGLYSSIGRKLGIDSLSSFQDPMVHLASNGHRTGNVATTFLTFYYDAGMIGVIVLCILMAIIMHRMYSKAKTDVTTNVSYRMIFYSYFCFLLARSFFSNSLLNALQLSMIKFIVIVFIESVYINRIKFKRR